MCDEDTRSMRILQNGVDVAHDVGFCICIECGCLVERHECQSACRTIIRPCLTASSKNRIGESLSSMRATASLCFSPPLIILWCRTRSAQQGQFDNIVTIIDLQASFSDLSIPLIRQSLNCLEYISFPSSFFDFFIRSIHPSISNISQDIRVEQRCILWYYTNSFA